MKVKKVSPYPFSASIQLPTGVLQGQILKLTEKGFLADVGTSLVKLNSDGTAIFSLPANHGYIQQRVRIVKTYDSYREIKSGVVVVPGGAAPAQPNEAGAPPGTAAAPKALAGPKRPSAKFHIVEAHFRDMTEDARNAIYKFMVDAGQVAPNPQ